MAQIVTGKDVREKMFLQKSIDDRRKKLVTAGRGYYQEWGKPAQELKPGDVVNIAPEVKHWHGAAPDSWFAHIAIEVPAEGSSNEWLEPVTDEEYSKLK